MADKDDDFTEAPVETRETVFVKHPITQNVKKAIVARGFRILDQRFAPEDAVIIDGQTGRPVGEKPKGNSKKAAAEA